MVSIHLTALFSFQFHYGAMGACHRDRTDERVSKLSIPLWCDGSQALRPHDGVGGGFQFHYGAMGARSQSVDDHWACYFQFHYGAMGARAIINIERGLRKLSIPLWCDGSANSSSP